MLLNIIPGNITKICSELFKYMVTPARVIFAAKWKSVECPDLKEWRDKLNEYVAMAKLTSLIHNRPMA